MQLLCRYDVTDPRVHAIYADGAVVDWTDPSHAPCVLVPFAGSLPDLGRVGPPPSLMGDPPTECYPDHAELDKHGVPVDHDLRALAGQPYRDNRRIAEDLRPYAAPPESDPVTLVAYLGHVRWAKETGGITVDKVPVATDRTSQGAVEKLASRAARVATFAPQFKGSDGAFYDVGNKGLVAIGDAVSDHIQACFDAEASLLADIKSGKVTAFKGIDNTFAKIG